MIGEYSIDSRNKLLKYIKQIQAQTPSNEFNVCSHFACGKKLTLIESLAGTKCTKHTYEKKVNPMMVFKFK